MTDEVDGHRHRKDRHPEDGEPEGRRPETGPGPQLPAGLPPQLGVALRRAWVGYQQRLDAEMATLGFADRSLPDARVLRLCARADAITASGIGRELGISRQGAGKIVARLQHRGYVQLDPSPNDARERVVRLTPRAHEYLNAHREAVHRIERDLRVQVGVEALEGLALVLGALTVADNQPRMRDYLRRSSKLP